MSQKEPHRIGLAEFLQTVRAELLKARDEAKEPILKLEDVELELSFVVTGTAKGGVNFWVVDLGGNYSKQQVHTVRLKLAPLKETPLAYGRR